MPSDKVIMSALFSASEKNTMRTSKPRKKEKLSETGTTFEQLNREKKEIHSEL